MSKLKIKVEKNPIIEAEVPVTPASTVEAEIPATPEPVKVTKKESWPEVGTTGRFNAVPFKDGYVVYNPGGQRATGIVSKVAADDIVRTSNQAAQIKVR